MVYLFLADGFEEIEALTPVDLLRRAGVEVSTVSITDSREVTGSHAITVTADMTLSQLDMTARPEMLILPGGMPGAKNLGECTVLCDYLTDCDKRGVYLAAICAAPSILGKLGLLRGRCVTCYPGWEHTLVGAAEVSKSKVVRDGHIITGKGMGVSAQFGLMLVSLLKGSDVAEELSDSIQIG